MKIKVHFFAIFQCFTNTVVLTSNAVLHQIVIKLIKDASMGMKFPGAFYWHFQQM